MVILRTRNKITDFFMILAWASPFKLKLSELYILSCEEGIAPSAPTLLTAKNAELLGLCPLRSPWPTVCIRSIWIHGLHYDADHLQDCIIKYGPCMYMVPNKAISPTQFNLIQFIQCIIWSVRRWRMVQNIDNSLITYQIT